MIGRIGGLWNRYWFSPSPLVNLAACRIFVVGYQLQHLVRLDHGEVLARQASLPDFMYDPLPVLHALIWPFGWTYRPGLEVLEAVYWVAVAAAALAVVGLFTRVSLVVLAVTSVFLQAHAYSFVGDVHHSQALLLIALAVLALGPSGKVLSLDRLRRRRRPGGGGTEPEDQGLLEAESEHARWPLLLITWTLSLAYLSAAVSKLQNAGWDWMNGSTLQYYLIRDGLRWDSALGVWIGEHHHVAELLSWMTVAFEGTFFLVLLLPALALVYVPIGVAMHVGIYLAMKAPFFEWAVLYSAVVPWRDLGSRLRDRLPAAGALGDGR